MKYFSVFLFIVLLNTLSVAGKLPLNVNELDVEGFLNVGFSKELAERVVQARADNSANCFRTRGQFRRAASKFAYKQLERDYAIYTIPRYLWDKRVTHEVAQLQEQIMTVEMPVDGVYYVQLPDGGNIVVNSGSSMTGNALLAFINSKQKRYKPSAIDWLIMPNLSSRYTGASKKILDNIYVRETWETVYDENDFMQRNLVNFLARHKGLQRKSLIQGYNIDLLQTESNVELHSMNMPTQKNPESILFMRYNKVVFLFMFDVSLQEQKKIFNKTVLDSFFNDDVVILCYKGSILDSLKQRKYKVVEFQKTDIKIKTDGYILHWDGQGGIGEK